MEMALISKVISMTAINMKRVAAVSYPPEIVCP